LLDILSSCMCKLYVSGPCPLATILQQPDLVFL